MFLNFPTILSNKLSADFVHIKFSLPLLISSDLKSENPPANLLTYFPPLI